MNLRKDHYRSFTRTVRTVHRSFPWGRSPIGESAPREPPRSGGSLGSAPPGASLPLECVRALALSTTPREIVNHTTRSDGYLGMSNDEERSEMRYVVRIAEFSESSKL